MLPVEKVLPDLLEALSTRDEVILEAPPGAGKTTAVPLALLKADWLQDQKIIVLEPRRIAAIAAAERMAELIGEKPGKTVGYRVRLNQCVGPETQIEVVTEGILTRMLQQDPSLEGIGIVIFDEFHERSLESDLALAFCSEGRSLFRDEDPLKLLIMSATLDGQAISTLLNNAPVIESHGRSYEVKPIYSTLWQRGEDIIGKTATTVLQAFDEQDGNILVFLPGQKEIRGVEQILRSSLNTENTLIAPLFGDLTLQQQRQAILPPPDGIRKIVLATNIAETSLTIEGIRIVVDSGLSREARFDPAKGMTRLTTKRLSKASSTQRAGRAGRLEPGVVYRLWSEGQQQSLESFTAPEMRRADLAPLALQLLNWGCSEPRELLWLDPPPSAPYSQAIQLLEKLGAVTNGQLTTHGQQMAQMPCHPRLAHMLISAARYGLSKQGANIAALLSERDPLKHPSADISLRSEWLVEGHQKQGAQSARKRLQQLAGRFLKLLGALEIDLDQQNRIAEDQIQGMLLALAYPDRIARRKPKGHSYKIANGRTATLQDSDKLSRSEWLAIADIGSFEGQSNDRVWLASALDPTLFESVLADQVDSHEDIFWDSDSNRIIARESEQIGAVIWREQPLTELTAEQREKAILNAVANKGLNLFKQTDGTYSLISRVQFLHHSIGAPWPDFNETTLVASAEHWLPPYLSTVNQPADLKKLDFAAILMGMLDWPLPQQLDEVAPERLEVPSGSKIKIDYSQQPPVLAVKLQEMFGCNETPKVGGGIAVKIQLLSPAMRPVQVTQDIAGFWNNSYPEVRKEMKGRYPKHNWPDDPHTAIASRRTTKPKQ